MKKNLIVLLMFCVVISGCASNTSQTNIQSPSTQTQQREAKFLTIKYRSDPVDVSSFAYLNTAGSSLVRGAWYDRAEQYMVINLNGTNYHYCEFPSYVWEEFMSASSFGSYYTNFIKGEYDCRINYLPKY